MLIEPTINIIVREAFKPKEEGDERIVDGLLEQKAEKEDPTAFAPRWSADAPKGGRAVLARAPKIATTICGAARRLLVNGVNPADTIGIWRNGKLSMSGRIGELAKLAVRWNAHGYPSLTQVKWRPFSYTPLAARTVEPSSPAMVMADADWRGF